MTWMDFVLGMEDMFGVSFLSEETFSDREMLAYVEHFLSERKEKANEQCEPVGRA